MENGNIIDKIFEFEDKYLNKNYINFNNENIKQEFEKLSKGHGKLYQELLYRPKEYRQELSKYYESLKSDIRPFCEISKIIGNDMEPIMSVRNIFAQEHGFESYNDMLMYSSKHFDGNSSIPIEKILELKNDVKTETIEELDKLLTPQEAFNKYEPNDDRFYTSQGLEPNSQKEKINELNSKKTPIENTPTKIINNVTELNNSEKIKWVNNNNLSSLATTDESKILLYNHINDGTDLSLDTLIRKNAANHSNDKIYHAIENLSQLHSYGLSDLEFEKALEKPTMEIVSDNLSTIINNKEAELSLTSNGRFGNIGVVGTADILAYAPGDVGSSVNEQGIRKTSTKSGKILDDYITMLKNGESPDKVFGSYNEYFGKNINIEALWVNEDFFNENKNDIIKLLKDNNINFLDIENNKELKQRLSIDEIDKIYANKQKPQVNEKPTKQILEDYKPNLDKVDRNPKPDISISEPLKEHKKLNKKQLSIKSHNALYNLTDEIKVKPKSKPKSKVIEPIIPKNGLSKGMKYGIAGLAIAVAGGAIISNIKNDNDAQMASDISSYRYGKRMTGYNQH